MTGQARSSFSTDDLTRFREALEEEARKLVHAARPQRDVPEIPGHDLSEKCSVTEVRETLGALHNGRRARLTNIIEAMERIGNGTYGDCQSEGCGKEIGLRRLNAEPSAPYCIQCQKGMEEAGKVVTPFALGARRRSH